MQVKANKGSIYTSPKEICGPEEFIEFCMEHDNMMQIIDELVTKLDEAREGLNDIESITSDDFKKGGFLCKELPENWESLALTEAKEIARAKLIASSMGDET